MRQNDISNEELKADFFFKTDMDTILSIFNYFDDTCFFIKDTLGRLIAVNLQLIQRYGLRDESDIIGKTDFDILPYSLAEKYKKDDLKVIESKKPMLRIIELALNHMGIPSWFTTNKIPIISKDGQVIGIMGTISKLENDQIIKDTGLFFNQIIEYIINNLCEKNLVKKISEHFKLSIRTLERYFAQYLNLTPELFIIRMRIFKACEFLKSGKSILAASVDCGFYDQSTFTRHFKKHMGLTPMQYIKKYAEP